jgi:hypothetical protein
MRTVVVLPAPLGPRKPYTSPGATSRSTPATAFSPPLYSRSSPRVLMAVIRQPSLFGRPAGPSGRGGSATCRWYPWSNGGDEAFPRGPGRHHGRGAAPARRRPRRAGRRRQGPGDEPVPACPQSPAWPSPAPRATRRRSATCGPSTWSPRTAAWSPGPSRSASPAPGRPRSSTGTSGGEASAQLTVLRPGASSTTVSWPRATSRSCSLLRLHGAVRAQGVHPGQEGLRRGPDRADVGARPGRSASPARRRGAPPAARASATTSTPRPRRPA